MQTFFPNNYVYSLVANYNYKKFYQKEINLRQTTNFPPFAEIVRILISNESEEKARIATREIYDKVKEIKIKYKEQVYFIQAMQSPLNRLKSKYRFQIIIRFDVKVANEIIDKIYEILSCFEKNKSSIFVEINP